MVSIGQEGDEGGSEIRRSRLEKNVGDESLTVGRRDFEVFGKLPKGQVLTLSNAGPGLGGCLRNGYFCVAGPTQIINGLTTFF
jgi:hypothetical protein